MRVRPLLGIVLAILVVGCGSDDDGADAGDREL
jgi:hypothetical protein